MILLNDRKVIANDFTYSFDRILDKRLASPGAWVLDKVKDYEAVNDSVFKIEAKRTVQCIFRNSINEVLLRCSKRNC